MRRIISAVGDVRGRRGKMNCGRVVGERDVSPHRTISGRDGENGN